MFDYEVLRNRWVVLVLFIGVSLVLLAALFFINYQKPRKEKEGHPGEYETRYLSAWEGIPSGLKVVMAVIVVFAITFSIYIISNPKSW